MLCTFCWQLFWRLLFNSDCFKASVNSRIQQTKNTCYPQFLIARQKWSPSLLFSKCLLELHIFGFTEGQCWNKGSQELHSRFPCYLGTPERINHYFHHDCSFAIPLLILKNAMSIIIVIIITNNNSIIATWGNAKGQNPKIPKKRTLRVQRSTTRGLRL